MAEICKATAPSRLLKVSKSAVSVFLAYSSDCSVVCSIAPSFELLFCVVLLTVFISGKCAPLTHSDSFEILSD